MDILLNANVGAAAIIVVVITMALKVAFQNWWTTRANLIASLFLSLAVVELLILKGEGTAEDYVYGIVSGFVCFLSTQYAHEKYEAMIMNQIAKK